ncbi:MAG: PEP-CTERM sorting domain-containing protein [bacterium]|nr:PEP-CTERM sorting domain-containing protein [bacterium]
MKRYLTLLVALGLVQTAQAGFIFEIDTDGSDDGVLTFNPNFAFGGDTTTASQSAPATVFGATGGDSIFGGDGFNDPDTYVYTHSPDSEPDNLVIPNGQDLGDGNLGTGVTGGSAGLYHVYAAWPFSSNVSGGPTTYDVTTAGDNFSVQIDQNGGGGGLGNVWVLLGDIDYTLGSITVTQNSQSNTFVSMRAYGLLFEAVPEPTTGLLLAAAGGIFAIRRRR